MTKLVCTHSTFTSFLVIYPPVYNASFLGQQGKEWQLEGGGG